MKNILKAGHIVSFLIGALFGSGAIWEYQKIEIENKKLELDKIEKTTNFRKELDALMEEILITTREFIPLNLCSSHSSRANNKAIELNAKLSLQKQNFDTLESKIAVLEEREPRDINLQFSAPCPPTGLSIK